MNNKEQRRARVSIATACFAALMSAATTALSATPAQLDSARTRAMAWLITHQNGDGSWGSTAASKIAATASAIEVFRLAQLAGYPYSKGLSWLANEEAPSTDSLARQIAAMSAAGMDVTPRITQLKAWQPNTTTPAWGAYPGYATSFPDTPLGIAALRLGDPTYATALLTNVQKALSCYVAPSQKLDGSWSYPSVNPVAAPASAEPNAGATGVVIPTAYNAFEIHANRARFGWDSLTCGATAKTYSLAASLSNALSWLKARQQANGGFADIPSGGYTPPATVLNTLLAYRVVNAAAPFETTVLSRAEDFLVQTQSADGSWGGDAFVTALVLGVMPGASTAMADGDGDGVPDAVEPLIAKNPAVADSRTLAPGNGNGPGPAMPGGDSIALPPTSSSQSAKICQNQSVSLPLYAGGGVGPFTWEIQAGSLPGGLSFTSYGSVVGATTTTGQFSIAALVTDALQRSAVVGFSLQVGATPVPIDFAKDFNKDCIVDGKDTALLIQIIQMLLDD